MLQRVHSVFFCVWLHRVPHRSERHGCAYLAGGEGLLVPKSNIIIGIGRDIRIEKDRDIFKGVNQFAVTVKAAVEFEEITAVVKVINVGLN